MRRARARRNGYWAWRATCSTGRASAPSAWTRSSGGPGGPSLYRSFSSKDELAASYLKYYDKEFWVRFDEAVAAHPGDPRAQIIAFLTRVGKRTQMPGYRGCGMTNAAVEYPQAGHPARVVGEENKRELRRRLRAMAAGMGAADPDTLGDGLLLLIEGAYISGQLFGAGGPAQSVARNADLLIQASLAKQA